MTTPDSPYSPLTKGESDNHPQLSRSKLGKDLGRGKFSHATAEHPWAVACLIGSIVIMIVSISAIVLDVRSERESILPLFYLLLCMVCILVWGVCMSIMFDPIPRSLISEAEDAIFLLKLIATGYSMDEVGRIMNSYLFKRKIWWTNSYFYDGKQCYKFFVHYSRICTDPVIHVFVEQANHKLAESLAQEWDRIGLSDE